MDWARKLFMPKRALARPVVALATILAAGSCRAGGTSFIVVEPTRPAPPATAPVTHAASNDSIVNARFQNVLFHVWPGVALELRDLLGRMHSQRTDGVVSFDDKHSFVLGIDTGVVGLPMSDLSTLMNTYVFAYQGAPLRDLEFTTEGTHLVQRGILHKGVDIPFEMVAEVSATADGQIRVHPVSMKICSINGKGLMDALGITLAKMLDVREAKGVRVDKNDLLLDPAKVLPAPAIAGHLVGVAVEPGRLMQYFGAGTEHVSRVAMTPDTLAANYMLFRGGTLQFGKLFMVHADMQVVDADPGDAFDFDIARYREQLVAGYSRTLPDQGLLVFMPDLAKAQASAR
jgi:hypothetical protein